MERHERYIEVIGESTLIETIQEYVADINLSVRASQPKTALDEVIALRDRCIETLIDSGLVRLELKEGGAEVWRSWFSRKQAGQEAFQKIMITCSEIGRLLKALSALEPLFENSRYSFALNMRRPTFSASNDLKQQARSAAIQDAYTHANLLATAAQLKLLEVAQIEEVSTVHQQSGVYGDESWRDAVGAAAFNAEDVNYLDLDQATRQVQLRYRVRFVVCSP